MFTGWLRKARDRVKVFFFGPDAFISYCYKDSRYAEPLAVALGKSDVTVFLAAWDASPGAEFSRNVRSALDTAQRLVVVGTPEARASQDVALEITAFSSTGRPVVVINAGGWMTDPETDWPLIRGIDVVQEPGGSFHADDPVPSAHVLARIRNATDSTRQRVRLRWFLRAVAVAAAVLASGAAGWSTWRIVAAQDEARQTTSLAQQNQIDAYRAQRAALARATAADAARSFANWQAHEATIKAEQAGRETIKQNEISGALRLANDSVVILQREPSRFVRAAVLAAGSMKRLQDVGVRAMAADTAIRASLQLLPERVETIAAVIPDASSPVVSHDSRFVTAVTGPGQLSAWDLENGTTSTIQLEDPESSSVTKLAMSADGSIIAALIVMRDDRRRIDVWRRADGIRLSTIPDQRELVALTLDGAGHRLAFVSSLSDGKQFLAVHDTHSGVPLATKEIVNGRLTGVTLNRGGGCLGLDGWYNNDAGPIRGGAFWPWTESNDVIVAGTPLGSHVRVVFDPTDDARAAVINGEGVAVWNWRRLSEPAGKPDWSTQRGRTMGSLVTFSEDATWLAITEGAEVFLAYVRPSSRDPGNALQLGRIARRVAVDSSRQVAAAFDDGTVSLFARTNNEIARVKSRSPAFSIAFRSDGSVRSVSAEGAKHWRAAATPIVSPYRAWTGSISKDGSIVVTASPTIQATPGEVRAFFDGGTAELKVADTSIGEVVLTPENGVIAGTSDGQILQWEDARRIAVAERRQVLKTNGMIQNLSLSADGRVLVWTDGNDVYVSDRPGYRPVRIPQPAHVSDVAISADGETIVAACFDNRVRVWSWRRNRHEPAKLFPIESVMSAAVSADGLSVAAAGWRGAQAWDLQTGEASPLLPGQSEIAIDSRGQDVVTAGDDGIVHVWRNWRATPTEVARFAPGSGVKFLQFSGDDRYLLVVTLWNGVHKQLWDTTALLATTCARVRPLLEPAEIAELRDVCLQ